MRALPLAVFPTIIVLAGFAGLIGRWLTAPAVVVELAPSIVSQAADAPTDRSSAIRVAAPEVSSPGIAAASSKPSEVPIAVRPMEYQTADEWTEAQWKSFVSRQQARFSNHAIHVEDHCRSVEIHHKMLANQRRFHDGMQSSDLNGDLKRGQIATDSRERELNSAIEIFQAATVLYARLLAVRDTLPVESRQFAPLLTEAAGKCAAAGDAFELAKARWAAARDSETRAFTRISKIYDQKKKSEAVAANSRHKTAHSLGEDAQREAKWAARMASIDRETIQTYRDFQVLKVEGELQKVDNLAVQNQKLAGELEQMARTLFQSSRMSESELSRHRKTVYDLSKKVDANEAEIDRTLAAMRFH